MDNSPDISKVINLIMENPELIASIKSMLGKEKEESTASIDESKTPDEEAKETVAEAAVKEPEPKTDTRGRRNALLRALKPYVSGERAKAIDTMMSLADVMDIIKGG